MTTARKNGDPPSKESLIQLAYGLVVGPEGFETLFDALQVHQADILDTAFSEEADDAPGLRQGQLDGLADLEAHFENALTLLRSQGRRKLSASSAIRTLNASIKPAMTLSGRGEVLHANPAAESLFGLSGTGRLDPAQFETGHHAELLDHLGRLETQPENTILTILGFHPADDGGLVKMSLSRTTGWQGRPVGLLSALHISWYPDVGQRFRDMMKLTKAELQITRAIVTGLPLSAVAEQRGSKLSTVRNQTKALLKKLGVRSQTELACLYSGFSRYSLESTPQTEGAAAQTVPPTALMVGRGHVIDYTVAGAPRGRPVLYLPGMLGGRVVTAALHAALLRHNVKLVMPWRPGFSKSYNSEPSADPFRDTARETETLLDALSLPRVPVVGQMTSAMHAFAAAHHLPGRIAAVVALAPGLPTVRGPHLRHIGAAQKLRSFLSREAPRVGRLIAHGFLSRVDAGYDVEFIRHYLKDSRTDLEFTRQAETIEAFRTAYEDTHCQGYDGFIDELGLFGSDWHHLFQGLECPIRFFVGEEETAFPPAAVDRFAQTLPTATMEVVPRTGHLIAYEAPDRWLSHLASLPD
ncbi:alpha/beta fold hydrolase [uncultured Algimonas sp.]|uniref:alpha/beta fold hydrolase n=1 Tax=uncultured Algimonas sp. TaxID=1547920 RepID=UPI00260E598F|nr:alpha/beta fold hydrolase [uncultured Algimonas sp.]